MGTEEQSAVDLRRLMPGDLPQVHEWLAIEEIRHMFDGDVPQVGSRSRAWGIWQAAPAGVRLIGWAELDDINRRAASAEMRVCIGRRDAWGHGFGTAAVRRLLERAQTDLKLREVYLRVSVDNVRAIRTYHKCGFRKEGLLRAGRHACLGLRDHWLMTWRAAAVDTTGRAS